MNYHKPVLVKEVLTYLAPKPHGVYIDATFGGGGHTAAILAAEPTCSVIAFDWDADALELNRSRIEEQFPGRVTFVWGNFAHLKQLCKKHKIGLVDGILADFGTSQYQIFKKSGFSFSEDSYLDMRMSPAHQKTTAAMVLNHASLEELVFILREYGEEWQAAAIAKKIIEVRKKTKIKTTKQLAELVKSVVRGGRKKIHPATKVFQALRIYVNAELENIRSFLYAATDQLKHGGRLLCISFHSLEDRLVKQFFLEQKRNQKGEVRIDIVTPKVIMAAQDELEENPSARSARLRAIQVSKVAI